LQIEINEQKRSEIGAVADQSGNFPRNTLNLDVAIVIYSTRLRESKNNFAVCLDC